MGCQGLGGITTFFPMEEHMSPKEAKAQMRKAYTPLLMGIAKYAMFNRSEAKAAADGWFERAFAEMGKEVQERRSAASLQARERKIIPSPPLQRKGGAP